MRIIDTLLVVIGLAGLAGLAWWGLKAMPAKARTIETELQIAAQDELQRAGHGWAQVTMDGQVATVRGTQPNAEMVTEAERAVLTSSGHGGLVYGGVTVVNSVIDAPAVVSPYTFSAVKGPQGTVALGGYVPNDMVRASLLDTAGRAGSGPAVDSLALGAGLPGEGWQSVAERGIDMLGRLDQGEARLRDTRLTVRGFARERSVRAELVEALAALPAPFTGEADLRGPGRWSARHFGGELILAGAVDSEEERAEIVALAREHFDGSVVDQMMVGVASGEYPDWLAGVRLGLPHFARFLSGEMAFDPEGDGYRFEGEATGSALRYLREDLAGLDGPYGVTLNAEAGTVDVAEIADVDFAADPREACEAAFAAVLATNTIVFETGSAAISRESGETLDKLMAVSGQCDPSLVFELGGHTDNQGSRGGNLRLSEARAEAVAAYMAEAGFDAARLVAVGYGPDAPIADNDTEAGRAANRRLEIKVLERSE